MSDIQDTGGDNTFILQDEDTDSVSSILGVTCTDQSAEFDGDGVTKTVAVEVPLKPALQILEMPPQKLAQAIDITSRSGDDGLRDSNKGSDCPTKHLNPSNKMSHQGKKLSEEVQMAQREKDIEMRSFIHEKAQKVKLENKILELQILKSEYELTNMQNEKIKSDEIKAKKTNYELKKLKLDNEKTDNEIRYLQLKNIKLGLEIEDLKQKMANNKWNISEVYKF